MPFYKDTENKVHFMDSHGFEHLLPAGSTKITDDDAAALQKPTADQAKASKWDAIKTERDRRTEQGGYKVGAKWFHSDQKSRSQQLGLNLLALQVLAAGGTSATPLPGVTPWKTMDGTEVVMTAGLAQQILAAGAASDSAIFDAAKAHKTAMEASTDPSAYDFSAAWPATFAG